MPLLRKKPFTLVDPPKDLEPHELVYQVRYTKEIFRDYQEYLKRIDLYRARVWICKSTGKKHLTYEEALVSEKLAAEKVQELPEELVQPALRIIQFSMLSLKDLSKAIASKLQKCLFVGAELSAKKNEEYCPCKILKVLEEDSKKPKYEVGWLTREKKISGNAVLSGEDLVWKKFPFSRHILKSFIRESTSRSIPWVLHEKLAKKNKISTDLPDELRNSYFFQDGQLVFRRKRKNNEEDKKSKDGSSNRKKKKLENGRSEGSTADAVEKEDDDQQEEEPIKYPIDDLLVQPGPDDPVFTERPIPSRDFSVPINCVGNLLLVWDFCSTFGRQLHLWPFSLEDFENAICQKESNLILIVELHASLLRSLMDNNGDYFLAAQKRSRKLKITLVTWTEFLCDFLEISKVSALCSHLPTIKRGHYGLLDVNVKLEILRELVNLALESDGVRQKLDENIEQLQKLAASRRGEAIEEGRKKRELKDRLKAEAEAEAEAGADGVLDGHSLEGEEIKMNGAVSDSHSRENGSTGVKKNGNVICPQQDDQEEKSENKHIANGLKKNRKENTDLKSQVENVKVSSGKKALKQTDEGKETSAKQSLQQRKEYFEREMEKQIVRTNSLGKDRDYNRYWWFRRDGRIFVENSDLTQWAYYSSKEELDALMGSLNCKGERELALQKQLEKYYDKICLKLQKTSKEVEHKITEEEAVLRRSTRVRASPRENPANSFLRYVNKWKED